MNAVESRVRSGPAELVKSLYRRGEDLPSYVPPSLLWRSSWKIFYNRSSTQESQSYTHTKTEEIHLDSDRKSYLSTHTIFTAVLIVLIYRLLFHLKTQRWVKSLLVYSSSMQAGDSRYLFPPLQLTEDSLEAFVHVVKLNIVRAW